MQMHFCRFKAGSTNCIVATDVVDEGIDVPACTLIIRFDMPMDFRGYVQSKGRARHSSSQYIVLMPKDDVAFLQRYQNYKNIELRLKMVSIPTITDPYIKNKEDCRIIGPKIAKMPACESYKFV